MSFCIVVLRLNFLLPALHFYLSSGPNVTALLFDWCFVTLSTPAPWPNKQTLPSKWSFLSVVTDHKPPYLPNPSPLTSSSSLSPLHLHKPEFLSPLLIHTCPSSTTLFECLFLLSFATKANGLLPVMDTVLALCRVKPNAYLRAQACVSHY